MNRHCSIICNINLFVVDLILSLHGAECVVKGCLDKAWKHLINSILNETTSDQESQPLSHLFSAQHKNPLKLLPLFYY